MRLDMERFQSPPAQTHIRLILVLWKGHGRSPRSGGGSMILAAIDLSVQSQRGNSRPEIVLSLRDSNPPDVT
jgi:hypothetical protein